MRPGMCFAGRREGPYQIFFYFLYHLNWQTFSEDFHSGTRKSPQGSNLESRAAGGQKSSHALSKIRGYGVTRQQMQHEFCGNATHLQFFT